jgi:hypothetical protein
MTSSRPRTIYVSLALVTIAAGLLVHWRGSVLPPAARDIVGDALWATMITWWVSAVLPFARLQVRIAWALSICAAVECSQLYHSPGVDVVRATTLGHLVLGSDFDPRDLAAYALGVATAALLDGLLVSRSSSDRSATR